MSTYVELSCSWAQVFNLPSSCPWIPVSPVAGRWTLEHPGQQPYSSCKYRHPCTHTRIQVVLLVHTQTLWLLQRLPWTPLPSSSQLFPWSYPQRHTQGTNPYHLLIISSSSISPCSHTLTCTPTLTPVVGTMDTRAPLTCGSTPWVVSQTHTHLCTQSAPQLGKWLEMGFSEKPQQTASQVQGIAKQVN